VNLDVQPARPAAAVDSPMAAGRPAAVPARLVVAAAASVVRPTGVKRAIDLMGSGLALVAFSPLMGLIAWVVRRQSPGPVLFRQVRVGRNGRIFGLLKFRTMVVDAEQQRAALLAFSRDPNWLHLDHDPRITPVGRLLRRTSLDELPQLWNVLRGDMSLVGPRPLVPAEDARVCDWARRRGEVAPGITGPWQVAGRTAVPFEDMLVLDADYVARWSLWRDVQILLRTFPVVLSGKGAN
jgi:lipopolysaccharide/colanic/teichoic acid biosynthesis glycosyltransferase